MFSSSPTSFCCVIRLLWSVIWVAYTDLHVLISIWFSKILALWQIQPSITKKSNKKNKKTQSVWNRIFCTCWNTWKYSNCTTKVHSAGDSGCKWHLWPADCAADQLGPQEDRYWRQMPQESHSFDKGCYRFCFRVFWGETFYASDMLLVMSWNV